MVYFIDVDVVTARGGEAEDHMCKEKASQQWKKKKLNKPKFSCGPRRDEATWMKRSFLCEWRSRVTATGFTR